MVAAACGGGVGRVAIGMGIASSSSLVRWSGPAAWWCLQRRVRSRSPRVAAGPTRRASAPAPTLPVLEQCSAGRGRQGGSYATSSAVVSTTRQLGAVLGVAVMVILIGKPDGTAEEALRRGWPWLPSVSSRSSRRGVGRTNRNPIQMPAPELAIAPRLVGFTDSPAGGRAD